MPVIARFYGIAIGCIFESMGCRIFMPSMANGAAFLRSIRWMIGYAVIWNDEIYLAESELWLNGTPAEPGASSNGGPEGSLGDSGVTARPLSIS